MKLDSKSPLKLLSDTVDQIATPALTNNDTVTVKVTYTDSLREVTRGIFNQLLRQNRHAVEFYDITLEDLDYYVEALIYLRVEVSNSTFRGNARLIKSLNMPWFVETLISRIGHARLSDFGLSFVPVFSGDFTFDADRVHEISNKLELVNDLIMIVHGFPMDQEGDYEFMSTYLVNDIVMSITKLSSPLTAYLSAFLGTDLVAKAGFDTLYRVKYCDVQTVLKSLIVKGVK